MLGGAFGALATATVGINQLVGPVMFKIALDRTGESRTSDQLVDALAELT